MLFSFALLLLLFVMFVLYQNSNCLSTPIPVEPETYSGKLHHRISIGFHHERMRSRYAISDFALVGHVVFLCVVVVVVCHVLII